MHVTRYKLHQNLCEAPTCIILDYMLQLAFARSLVMIVLDGDECRDALFIIGGFERGITSKPIEIEKITMHPLKDSVHPYDDGISFAPAAAGWLPSAAPIP